LHFAKPDDPDDFGLSNNNFYQLQTASSRLFVCDLFRQPAECPLRAFCLHHGRHSSHFPRRLRRLAPDLVASSAYVTSHTLARRTASGYSRDERLFEEWATSYNVPAGPATVMTIDLYLTHVVTSTESHNATSKAHAAIAGAHRRKGHVSPTDHPKIKELMRGSQRLFSRPSDQTAPFTADNVARLVRRLLRNQPSPVQWRTAWVSLMAFQTASRMGDLAKLSVEHLVFLRTGDLEIRFPFTKTIPVTKGFTVTVTPQPSSDLCPVRLSADYIKALGLTRGDRLIPAIASRPRGVFHVRKHQTASGQALLLALRKVLSELDLDPSQYNRHSFRRGSLLTLRDAGHSATAISERAGWSSPQQLLRYTHESSRDQKATSSTLHLK